MTRIARHACRDIYSSDIQQYIGGITLPETSRTPNL